MTKQIIKIKMTVNKIESRGLTLTGSVQQLPSMGGARVGVTIRAGSGDLWVGNNDSITAGTTDSTDGVRIPAGEREFITISNSSNLYVIGTSADKITYLVE